MVVVYMDAIYYHARFDDLDLDAKSQWVGKGHKKKLWMLSATKQAICIKRATTVGFSFFYVTMTGFVNVYMA